MSDIKLSIIVPTYNEERRISKTLVILRQYLDARNYNYEVIVSDDGSTDTTISIIQIIQEGWPRLRLIQAPYNQGKGATVKRAVLDARGQFVLFTDADNSTPIREIEKLWPYTKNYQVVFGSRHCPGAEIHIPQAPHRIILSRLSNVLTRLLAVSGVYDTQCGFKLFEKNVGKNIFANVTIDRWGFDFEALMIARRLGYKIKEVGIRWYNDEDSKVQAGKEALRTLLDLIRTRWRINHGFYDKVGYIKNASAFRTTQATEPSEQEIQK